MRRIRETVASTSVKKLALHSMAVLSVGSVLYVSTASAQQRTLPTERFPAELDGYIRKLLSALPSRATPSLHSRRDSTGMSSRHDA